MWQNMIRIGRPSVALFVVALFFGPIRAYSPRLLAGSSAGFGGSESAYIVVRLPASARLYIDDTLLKQTGERRRFVTPPLEQGYVYASTLRMELAVDGGVVSFSKRIEMRAGQTVNVDLGLPAAEVAKPAPQKQPIPAGKSVEADTLSRAETEVLRITNKERQDAGLGPLTINATLMKAARQHSANMARQRKMDHVLDEKDPSDRLRELSYRGLAWGENIAYGMPTAADAMRAWMDSEGHRANILNESYNEIGLGIVTDERGVPYYTQVFGRSPK